MHYSKGENSISIEFKDPAGGKKPGLYVSDGKKMLKVASFNSAENACIFRVFLEYFFDGMLVKDKEDDHSA